MNRRIVKVRWDDASEGTEQTYEWDDKDVDITPHISVGILVRETDKGLEITRDAMFPLDDMESPNHKGAPLFIPYGMILEVTDLEEKEAVPTTFPKDTTTD